MLDAQGGARRHRVKIGIIAVLIAAATAAVSACSSSGGTGAGGGSGSSSAPLVSLNLGVNSPTGAVIAPAIYASKVNLWAKYGLKVTTKPATPSASVAALEGGSTDITLDGLGLISEAVKTKNITIIGTDAIQYYNLIAKPSRKFKPVKTIADLKQFNGMTVGVTTPGSTIDTVMHTLASKAGIKLKYDYLSTVPPATAVSNGIVDFAGATASNLSQTGADKTVRLGSLANLDNSQGLYGVIGANSSWLKGHQDVALKFAQAYAAAVTASLAHQDTTVAALAASTMTEVAATKVSYDLQKPYCFIKPFPTSEMNYDLNVVYKQDPTVAKINPSAILNNSILFNSDGSVKSS